MSYCKLGGGYKKCFVGCGEGGLKNSLRMRGDVIFIYFSVPTGGRGVKMQIY